MFLIAEYCDSNFYMGWHLYFRDNKLFKRNNDGGWGWINRPRENLEIMEFMASLGITIKGDGTCDDDGISEFAKRFPLKGRKCGGKIRGGVEINIVDGRIYLKNKI
jgi:hypothetical protein